MTKSFVPALAAGKRGELVEISESDFPETSRFIAGQSHKALAEVEARLRWILLENPARELGAPLGCGLRSSGGELVGCILYLPQWFQYQDKRFVVMGSSSFYVEEHHRGQGGLVFLRYSQLNRRWALFGNSANAEAARLWKALGAVPVGHSDHEWLGVINWKPVIEEIVERKSRRSGLSRLAGSLIAPFVSPFKRPRSGSGEFGELLPLNSVEEVMELHVDEASTKITAIRDLPYIRWRYFSRRDPTTAAFAFRDRRLGKDILVTVNERLRGYRGQIKTLNVLDIYPEVAPEGHAAIVSTLLWFYRDRVDVVALRDQDPDRQRVLRGQGFLRREFEAPNAWFLDRFSIIPRYDWYLVPADGDWLI